MTVSLPYPDRRRPTVEAARTRTGAAAPTGFDAAIGARLATVDQRFTKHRRALVSALASIGRPATVPEIVETVGAVPLSTAYRNIAVLVTAGAVRRVAGPDDVARYELTEAVTGHHHHHLVCNACGTVTDVVADAALERALAGAADRAARNSGFQSVEHRIDLVGVCARCA